jgi:predicted O-linked N-acetylglucosamine transferase (SPINDLY family)
MTLHFHPDYDAQAILAEHWLWAERHAAPLACEIRPHANARTPERRLRVGFVSPDLRDHPVGRLLRPLFTHHDRRGMEFLVYSDVRRRDAISELLASHVDVWHNIIRQSDAEVAERIRHDRVDILVDLALHTAQNRMLVFARKPAPVQVTMLGLPATTGLPTMDYRLTDPYLDPPGLYDAHYSEQSIRLPHCFWNFQPPPNSPPVTALPALRDGFVTFGCLAQFAKISRPALELWVKILQAMPDARLVLLAAPGSHRDAMRERFEQGGISGSRITFLPWADQNAYFARYGDLDLCLDSFPYNGHTTTIDALWMGVPVITLAGRTAVGRGGVSILSNVGLTELIAATPEHYVALAVAWASDLARLAGVRAELRPRMEASPLLDGRQYTADVEAALRTMWKSWCRL